ncbi:MAG: tetratricopeptide repeat protein [Longimicrobiales bacterium]
MRAFIGRVSAAAAFAVLAACGPDSTSGARGDALWADSSYDRAIAEYRLALRETDNDRDVVARLAHAYAVTGQFDQARQLYEPLLEAAPEYVDQAVFDYMLLAQRARARSDRFGMANAVDAALALRPGVPLGETSAALARHYAQTGDAERAVDFFERALAEAPPDSVPALLFELGTVQESRGDCAEALAVFNAYRTRAPRGPRAEEARWHVGNCSYELGRAARADNRAADALRSFDTLIRLGVPQNLVDQAWFERGEILLAQGRGDEALEAYYRVLERNPGRRNQLTERAQRRIDELRFGRTGTSFPPGV